MAVINLDWLNQNETRAYPLSDAASAESSAGLRLPPGIIVDMSLRYPEELGFFPFLASIALTANLISLTFQCAADPDDVDSFVPLAVISMPLSRVTPYRNYALSSQSPGVGGWIMFGAGITEGAVYTGRFGPAAGGLTARAARPYAGLPVTEIGKLNTASPLTGVVKLQAQQPIEIVSGVQEVEGITRNVAFIGLVQPTATAGLASANAPSVFSQFTGPCGNRPESGNCPGSDPIEYINTVPPDCNGNITIEFAGCAVIAGVVEECGIVVDCGLGLSEVCPPSQLPNSEGILPNDYHDSYASTPSETPSESAPIGGVETGPGNYFSQQSESIPTNLTLPLLFTFDAHMAPNFYTLSGQFTYVSDDGPDDPGPGAGSLSTETSRGKAQQNLIIWTGYDATTIGLTYTTELKIVAGGANNNGGFVLNWRVLDDLSGRYVYYLVKVDYDSQMFGIFYFDGAQLVPTSAFTSLTGIQQNAWYKITVSPVEVADGVQITATLDAITGPALSATLILTTDAYLPDTGQVGFETNRSYTRFAYLAVARE